jgi:hypothetical protein
MKKSLIVLIVLILMATTIFFATRTSPAENVANAEDKVMKAQKNLDNANIEYLADMEVYRQETEAKIDANNRSIAAFDARVETEKAEARAEYKRRITELEQMNTDMKKRLDDYKADGKDNWDKFKIEFSHDMDELGKAFKDLTVSNVK